MSEKIPQRAIELTHLIIDLLFNVENPPAKWNLNLYPTIDIYELSLDQVARLIASHAPTAKQWWCEHCQSIVPPEEVTYEETHQVCGNPVGDPPSPTADHDEVAEEIAQKLDNVGFLMDTSVNPTLVQDAGRAISAILARHYGREGK